MQIKVRITTREPRNISLTINDAKKYHELNFGFDGPENITSVIFKPRTIRLTSLYMLVLNAPLGKFLHDFRHVLKAS